ncbi:MAG: hypothetical protein RMZ41_031275 [Nostoc sp. DedVER02]
MKIQPRRQNHECDRKLHHSISHITAATYFCLINAKLDRCPDNH